MEKFLKTYSSVPNSFIDEFFSVLPENLRNRSEPLIDFDTVLDWLDVRKDNLKRLLIDNFVERMDYTIEKIKVANNIYFGSNYVEKIMLTPDCFKELCMLSRTTVAKQVRLYYISVEKLMYKYHYYIQEKLLKKINVLEANQKPKIDIKGGVIYFFRALNQVSIDDLDKKDLFKIGKTVDINNRMGSYNSGNANDIKPLFILEVNDIDKVESCVKMLLRECQYRKNKEIYKTDVYTIKTAILQCDEFIVGFGICAKNHGDEVLKNNLDMLQKSDDSLLLLIDKHRAIPSINVS